MKKITLFLIVFSYSSFSFSIDLITERRKDQNPTESAHLFVPLPYSKPGIGDGFAILGTMSNVLETTADISLVAVTGDAEGIIVNGSEVPLFRERLFLNFTFQDVSRASVNNYSIRGINGSNKNDYTILDLSGAKSNRAGLNLTFYDRRLNFLYSYSDFEYKIDAIRDNDGKLISKFDKSFVSTGNNERFGFLLDLTDDYLDAKKGVRLEIGYQDNKAVSIREPDYYTLNLNLLGYIPFRGADTLVLNYYQSDANVKRQGDVNPANIRTELNSGCAPSDSVCLSEEQKLVNNIISGRKYGTSSSLGGDLRLRSFSQGRYQGAHTAFVGFEYRWNISSEVKPFNYLFWKDVRTGIQVAFFGELGSVSEKATELWNEKRHSVGAGVRLVAASGAVYRADYAFGDEGSELIVIFNYPWE